MSKNENWRCEVCDSPMWVECNCFCDCWLPHSQCVCLMKPEDWITTNDKLEKIYEKVSNKTLNFWCILKDCDWFKSEAMIIKILAKTWKSNLLCDDDYRYHSKWYIENPKFIKWHKVMYWDFINYIEKTNKENYDHNLKRYDKLKIDKLWKNKTESIDLQDIEAIEFVYNYL